MPHIHVDFHEQGINNPYYFAPAVEPYHEVITDWQRNFNRKLEKIMQNISIKMAGTISPKKVLIYYTQVTEIHTQRMLEVLE